MRRFILRRFILRCSILWMCRVPGNLLLAARKSLASIRETLETHRRKMLHWWTVFRSLWRWQLWLWSVGLRLFARRTKLWWRKLWQWRLQQWKLWCNSPVRIASGNQFILRLLNRISNTRWFVNDLFRFANNSVWFINDSVSRPTCST